MSTLGVAIQGDTIVSSAAVVIVAGFGYLGIRAQGTRGRRQVKQSVDSNTQAVDKNTSVLHEALTACEDANRKLTVTNQHLEGRVRDLDKRVADLEDSNRRLIRVLSARFPALIEPPPGEGADSG